MADTAEVGAIRSVIATDTSSALYVLRVIWDRQTPREKYYREHMGHDGRGFREYETPTLCALHDDLEDSGWRVAPAQADMLRERMPSYAKQFIDDSRERGVNAMSRLPRRPGHDGTDATVKRGKGSRKLTDTDKERIARNLDRMAERAGV